MFTTPQLALFRAVSHPHWRGFIGAPVVFVVAERRAIGRLLSLSIS